MRIEELRKQGYEVYITHLRDFDLYQVNSEEGIVSPDKLIKLARVSKSKLPKELHKYASPTGGETIVKLVYMGKQAFGSSECSVNDAFSHKKGLQIALGRALRAIHLEGKFV